MKSNNNINTLKAFILSGLLIAYYGLNAQVKFQKHFNGGSAPELAYGVKQVSNGNYIVLGGSNNSSSATGGDHFILEIDVLGNVVRQKTFGASLNQASIDFVDETDSSYILHGHTYMSSGSNNDIHLYSISKDFSQIYWNRVYGGGSMEVQRKAVKTNGGFVACGWTQSAGSGWQHNLFKVTTSGSFDWGKAWGGSSTDKNEALCATTDGGFLVVGDLSSNPISGADLSVYKVNAGADSIVWGKIYNASTGDHAHSVVQTKDGNYVVAGLIYRANASGGGWLYDMFLMKIDDTGSIIWSNVYGDTLVHNWTDKKLIELDDSTLVLAGTGRGPSGNGWDAFMLKIDKDGDLIWSRRYGSTADDLVHDVAVTNDGGFILAGATKSFGAGSNYDVWVIKTDANGLSGCNEDTTLISQDEQSWTSQNRTYSFTNLTTNTTTGNLYNVTFADSAQCMTNDGSSCANAYLLTEADYNTTVFNITDTAFWFRVIPDNDKLGITFLRHEFEKFDADKIKLFYGNSNCGELTEIEDPYPIYNNSLVRIEEDSLSSSNTYFVKIQQNAGDTTVLRVGTNEAYITKHLEMLSRSIIGVYASFTDSSYTAMRDTMLSVMITNAARAFSGYHAVSLKKFMEQCESHGLNMRTRMNNIISSEYNLPGGKDYVGMIEDISMVNNTRFAHHIVIPYLHEYLEQEVEDMSGLELSQSQLHDLLAEDHYFAYHDFSEDYPLFGFQVGELGVIDVDITRIKVKTQRPTFITIATPHWCILTDDNNCQNFLRYCFFNSCYSSCRNCSPSTNYGGLSDLACGAGVGFWEFEIEILVYINANNSEPEENNCFYFLDGQFVEPFYGILEANIEVFNYYRLYGDWSTYMLAELMNLPIRNNSSLEEGNKLTLCHTGQRFNQIEEYDEAFSLAKGGVYTLKIPNLQTLYFAFPYPAYMWYFNGPDMRIIAGYEISSDLCGNSCGGINKYDVTEEYSTCGSSFLNSNIFGFNNDYIVTTDKDFLFDYWTKPAITVALGGGSMFNECAYKQLYSSSDPSPGPYTNSHCNNITELGSAPGNLGTLVCTLTKTNSTTFEISKELSNSIQHGDTAYVHVYATFPNGVSIDKYVLLYNDISPTTHWPSATVEIRGKIIDYEIKIYKK